MRLDAAPDPDWYFDHVLAVADAGSGRIGPARARHGDWLAAVRAARSAARRGPEAAVWEIAEQSGLVVRRAAVLAAGVSPGRLRGLTGRGEWSVPRHGVVCPLPSAPTRPDGRARVDAVRPHGLARQIRASAVALVRPGVLVSHESAATMHGLPVIGDLARPTLSTDEVARAAGRRDAVIRCVGIPPADVTDWFGTPVTVVARTIVDVARCSGVPAGLVAADAALHEGLTSPDELRGARLAARFRPGVRNADRVLDLADGRAESALESLVRLCLIDGGLPAPQPQCWITTHRGRYRVDLLYEDERVVVEADGELKYRDRADNAPFVAEKRRHEALVRTGFTVVRVSWSDVWNEPADVVARVRRAQR